MEIEIQLARGVHTRDTVDALYAFTDCETSIAANLLVIRENRPQITTVTDVIRYNTERLVELLRTELKLEERRLTARHHAKTLEQIFIENRIYKSIEEETTSEDVYRAVFDGLEHFKENIRAEVSREDVENLLKIPIRRISLYDINKVTGGNAGNSQASEGGPRQPPRHPGLRHRISSKGVIEKYRADHSSEDGDRKHPESGRPGGRPAKSQAALRQEYRLSGSPGQRRLHSGCVSVRPCSGNSQVRDLLRGGRPRKALRGQGHAFLRFHGDEDRVFNIFYKENRTGFLYIKRCKIDKFILNRGYELAPEGCRILKLTTDSSRTVRVLLQTQTTRANHRRGIQQSATMPFAATGPGASAWPTGKSGA